MDEANFPLYYEDVDLCLRVRQSGLKVIYDPEVVVDHFEIGSCGDQDAANHPGNTSKIVA